VNKSSAEVIVTRLLTNAANLKYGSVSATANVHDGRIVSVIYSVTENTRETETKESEAKDAS
jgi:hypothetical protein